MKQAGADAGGAEEAAKGDTLTAAMKVILQKYKISVQRYWNATLVGPDVRKFLFCPAERCEDRRVATS